MQKKDDKLMLVILGIGIAFIGGITALCFSYKCKKKKKMAELTKHQGDDYESDENVCQMKNE